MIDLLLKNGFVITMDRDRRVLEQGAVAVDNGRIIETGESEVIAAKYQAKRTIDCENKAIMPGLIDSHEHAGHALVKTLGDGDDDVWFNACKSIYMRGSDIAYWEADAKLTALERLQNGVTMSVVYFGGGDSVTRIDDPKYAAAHLEAVNKVGIREYLAVGPCRPPYPSEFGEWTNGSFSLHTVDFEKQMHVTEELLQQNKPDARTQTILTFPVYGHRKEFLEIEGEIVKSAQAVTEMKHKYNVRFTQDGHRRNTIKYQHDVLHFTDEGNIYSHSVNLTDEEIELCAKTKTTIVHNPSACASITGRCPVPELLSANVTVAIGSDAYAPDRGADMFRHMFHGMHYIRTSFKDSELIPPGKMLEMVTIDAAKGLGLETEIGSLEQGKKADIILIDLAKPHLFPLNMIPSRLAYFAKGSDVDTVIVDGEILMENRQVLKVNVSDVLHEAQEAADTAIRRTGFESAAKFRPGYWSNVHY